MPPLKKILPLGLGILAGQLVSEPILTALGVAPAEGIGLDDFLAALITAVVALIVMGVMAGL